MKSQTLKTIGGALSAVALISGGATVAVAAPTDAANVPVAAIEAASEAGTGDVVKASAVEGAFSFDQNAITGNETFSSMFAKAAAVLCNGLPVYEAQAAQAAIEVNGVDGSSFTATVDEMAEANGAESYTMACACSTNTPGGGAIANAEVEGVSLATIMKMMAA
ncbi:hypothetical protein [Adlercreutzia caecimuris]|uniref:hypothetical protein n=1 Tax=Adlercreutzia caecimuris TaxID=671266 RepID=UPI000EE0B5D4|nr:hypothetical protein [Adlercreutzia caecimuris]NBJ65848.1 hypothetical protein [Adlercreutzia caecimuris]